MELKEKAVELFKSTATMMPTQIVQKAASAMSKTNVTSTDIKVPILTNDSEVRKFVEEFELYKLDNMVKFIFEGVAEQFKVVVQSVNVGNKNNMIDSINYISDSKDLYELAESAKKSGDLDDAKDDYKKARDELIHGINLLAAKATNYIDEIRKIDNRPRWQYFLRANLERGNVECYNNLAKEAVNAILSGCQLLFAVADNLSEKEVVFSHKKFDEIKDNLLSGDNCSLMHAYDKNKESEFWTTLADKFDIAMSTSNMLTDFVSACQSEDDIDYDEVDYS